MDSEPPPADPRSPPGPPFDVRRAGVFVADPDTMSAVEAALPEWEVDAHEGNIRTAIGVLAGEAPLQLILVELDGDPYPAGSIHELAAVCDVGTVVVALGSQDSARYSRDILATGVADYLIKPVEPARIREVVAGALASGDAPDRRGRSVGFAGTGGSGATTLLAATAVTAAARGQYVALLDLNRVFSALPFLLDVEPAAGLDELLDSAEAGAADQELVEAARVSHSDRISVFGYRWSVRPAPAPSLKGVRQLLADLCRQFHLVLVDPEPSGRVAVLRDCDVRVLVSEPTLSGARRAALASAVLGAGSPIVHVRNRTRPLRRAEVRRALRAAGVAGAPDVEVPFEADVPELADWGHLYDRFPRRLRKPLRRLTDRLDAAA